MTISNKSNTETVQNIDESNGEQLPLYILYGSVTGNAQSIAKRIYEEAVEKKYPAQLKTLNEFKRYLQKEYDGQSKANLVIVVSTTGNGDVPENGELYWRWIKRKSRPENYLENFTYGILALGDTNYDKFCNAGKLLDTRMNELSAKRFCKRGEADEETGLEQVVEPWIDHLWAHLSKLYHRPLKQHDEKPPSTKHIPHPSHHDTQHHLSDANSNVIQSRIDGKLLEHHNPKLQLYKRTDLMDKNISREEIDNLKAQSWIDDKDPFYAKVIGAQYLTTSSSQKQVLHMEFDIVGSGLENYHPGDAIGVICQNDQHMVDQFLKLLKQKGTIPDNIDTKNDKISLQWKADQKLYPTHICKSDDEYFTLQHLFTDVLDISSTVSVPQLRVLSKFCTNESERQKLTNLCKHLEEYRVQIQNQKINFVDFFQWFPSCTPPLDQLIEIMEPLKPRYYSITSSPIKHQDEIHIAFSIVQYETPEPYSRKVSGLCTNWLHHKAQEFWGSEKNVYIPIFMRKTPEFRLPENSETPIIMIGPGTGVAPFRSFLYQREAQVDREQRDNNWLFFGCRSLESDYLYHHDWKHLEQSKLQLNTLVASSREADVGSGLWYGGCYLQDFLVDYGFDIIEMMMLKNGHLYVCGDAKNMAKDVYRVLVRIVQEECGYTKEEAENEIIKWQNENRFQMEVWS